MRADPKPDNLIALDNPQCAVAKPNSHRINRLCRMYLLEAQALMIRILSEQTIRFPCLTLNPLWQLRESFAESVRRVGLHSLFGLSFLARPSRCSTRASSANRLSRLLDLANACSQR